MLTYIPIYVIIIVNICKKEGMFMSCTLPIVYHSNNFFITVDSSGLSSDHVNFEIYTDAAYKSKLFKLDDYKSPLASISLYYDCRFGNDLPCLSISTTLNIEVMSSILFKFIYEYYTINSKPDQEKNIIDNLLVKINYLDSTLHNQNNDINSYIVKTESCFIENSTNIYFPILVHIREKNDIFIKIKKVS